MVVQLIRRGAAWFGRLPAWTGLLLFIAALMQFFWWLTLRPDPLETLNMIAGLAVGLPLVLLAVGAVASFFGWILRLR